MAKKISDEIKRQSSEYLHKKFIEWEHTTGKRGTVVEFSKFIGINDRLVTKWMNAVSTPENENVIILANSLGPEIYDILGWPRPKVEDPPPVVLPVVVEKQNNKKTRVGQVKDPALALNKEK